MNKEFLSKVIKIQSELKAPKNQYNKFGNYRFRSNEDILEAVKPLLASNELILTVSDELVLIGERYYVKATARLTDGESEIVNTAWAREEETKKGVDGSQITGATSSYARKYALNGLFCIDDTKDSDTTNVGETTSTANKATKKPNPTANNQSADAEIEKARKQIEEIKDVDTLKAYWELHPEFRQNKEIMRMVTERKLALMA